jgi:hypothetical protein
MLSNEESLTPEQRQRFRDDMRATKKKSDALRARHQQRQEENKLRQTYLAAINDAIKSAYAANRAELERMREASKAFTPGSFPTITFHFAELQTLMALQVALNDPETPFPPDDLKDAWAAFKARRA